MMRLDIDRVAREARPGGVVRGARYWGHLLVPSAIAAIWFRWAHMLHARGWKRLAAVTTLINQRMTGVLIHPASRIGERLFIPHTAGVAFYGSAGDDLTLYPACHVGPRIFLDLTAGLYDDCPRLGDRVRIGALAVVTGGVMIGDQVTVTVRAAVEKDVGAGMVALLRPRWRVSRPERPRSEGPLSDQPLNDPPVNEQPRDAADAAPAVLDVVGATTGTGRYSG